MGIGTRFSLEFLGQSVMTLQAVKGTWICTGSWGPGGGGRGIIQPIRAVLTSKKNTVPQSKKV